MTSSSTEGWRGRRSRSTTVATARASFAARPSLDRVTFACSQTGRPRGSRSRSRPERRRAAALRASAAQLAGSRRARTARRRPARRGRRAPPTYSRTVRSIASPFASARGRARPAGSSASAAVIRRPVAAVGAAARVGRRSPAAARRRQRRRRARSVGEVGLAPSRRSPPARAAASASAASIAIVRRSVIAPILRVRYRRLRVRRRHRLRGHGCKARASTSSGRSDIPPIAAADGNLASVTHLRPVPDPTPRQHDPAGGHARLDRRARALGDGSADGLRPDARGRQVRPPRLLALGGGHRRRALLPRPAPRPARTRWPERDRFVLCKGHAAPIQYAALAHQGYFPREELMGLRQIGASSRATPTCSAPRGVEVSTGSLGQGLSMCARDRARAAPRRPRRHRAGVRDPLRRRLPGGADLGGGDRRGPLRAHQRDRDRRLQPPPDRRHDRGDHGYRRRPGEVRGLRLGRGRDRRPRHGARSSTRSSAAAPSTARRRSSARRRRARASRRWRAGSASTASRRAPSSPPRRSRSSRRGSSDRPSPDTGRGAADGRRAEAKSEAIATRQAYGDALRGARP